MAKLRSINTKFWDDEYVMMLQPVEKLMFLYFLTNPLTNICGVYEITMRRMIFDTRLPEEKLRKILLKFNQEKKIYYIEGWIVIRNFVKNQQMNPSVKKGIQKCQIAIPEKITAKISQIDTSLSQVITASTLLRQSESESESELESECESEYPPTQPVTSSRRKPKNYPVLKFNDGKKIT